MPEVTDKVEGRDDKRTFSGAASDLPFPYHDASRRISPHGVAAVGIVALIDVLVINIIVIPLEERELAARFGAEYEEYRKRVPSRFLPWKLRP
jgi:hypothetical protein